MPVSICFPLTLKTIQCVKCHTMNWCVLRDKNVSVSNNRDTLSMKEWEIKDDSSTNKCYLIHNPGNICELMMLLFFFLSFVTCGVLQEV